jgi:DNA polymerase
LSIRYRAEYWRVKSLWYDCEEAAIAAVENPGEPQSAGRVVYVVEDSRFLFCYLPSGRRLAYPFPEIQERKTPWGAVKNALTYMGVDQYTRKWRRQVSYGGLLVENCLAGHTQILTARGWITLSDLQPSDGCGTAMSGSHTGDSWTVVCRRQLSWMGSL